MAPLGGLHRKSPVWVEIAPHFPQNTYRYTQIAIYLYVYRIFPPWSVSSYSASMCRNRTSLPINVCWKGSEEYMVVYSICKHVDEGSFKNCYA